MSPRAAVIAACAAILGAVGGNALADAQQAPVAPQAAPDVVSRAKFKRAVEGWRAARREVRGLRRTLRHDPDAVLALQVAGIAYGQDWRAMRRCWLSEGYRNAERRQRRIVRDNAAGSGAAGPAQFMPSTWRSTPYGHLDIYNVLAQAMATAYMWDAGRRREWAGAGC